MDILFTSDEEMLRDAARTFLGSECSTAIVREMEKDPKGYPPDLWRKVTELGWPGMALPEKFGGLEMPMVQLGLIFEEVGRALAPLPLLTTVVTAQSIAENANAELCKKVLPAVVNGEAILTFAFTEDDPRLVPDAVQMGAVKDGDVFVLNGKKRFVDNFSAAQYCLVAVRTAKANAEKSGLSLFLVDTASVGINETPLITLAKDRQSEVEFLDVRVSKECLVGELDNAADAIELLLDRTVALLCAQVIGAARKDAEMAVEYSKYREAFGQLIGSFQSIQHACADMLIWMDAASLLTYEALWKLDQGLWAGMEVSQAKAFCNEKCQAIARLSQTIHGGLGFMMEFDLQLWFRRISAWCMRMGSTFEHRARIARTLLDTPGTVRLGEARPRVPWQ